jgi:galactokinase
MKDILIAKFLSKFCSGNAPSVYFAPGRINIIGEHIDYNGGLVLPANINLGTYIAASFRADTKIVFYSENFNEEITIDFNDLSFKTEHAWANYPKGVMAMLKENGHKIDKGLNIYIFGNLPHGTGLSSSASVELATAVMLNHMFDFSMQSIDLVKLAQKAENEYMKLKCGIMDQFIIGMGKKGNAILLNTSNLQFEHIPLDLGSYQFVITNSMKERKLTESKYNERLEECRLGLKQIQKGLNVEHLCQLTELDFSKIDKLIADETIKRRVKHVVSENNRTIKAAELLKNGNIIELGELLNQSHMSLKNYYEVTGFELDTLQEIQVKQKGVLGSRMTGAGFGGCTITLISTDYIDAFINNVKSEYKSKTNLNAEFYVVTSANGASRV